MQFSILSWNIQGKRHFTKTSFKKIAPALQALPADILCLQEAHEAREKLSHVKPFHEFQKVMPGTGYNQNVILSRFPVSAHGDVHFPRLAPRRLEAALWADIVIGSKVLRIYNCHFGIVAVGPAARERQLKYVMDHASKHPGPVVICGDLNTTIPRRGLRRGMVQLFHLQPPYSAHINGEYFLEDERYAFVKVAEQWGFREATDISQSTWRVSPFQWELFKLKLDWLLVRDIETPSVVLHPYISDHKAIHAECVLR